MKLCKDCKYYSEQETEGRDLCTHEQSQKGGIRSIQHYSCEAMRCGICRDGQLFEPKDADA